MAKSQKDRQRAKKKKQAKRKRKAKQTAIARRRHTHHLEPSNKVLRKLAEAYELIEEQYFTDAEKILRHLATRHPQVPEVFEAQFALYQKSNNLESCCTAAKRWCQLVPRSPDALMFYAQSSVFCGRATIAFLNYRELIQQHPDHEHAIRARQAMSICEEECQTRIKKAQAAGFLDLGFEDGGLEIYAHHEHSLAELASGNFQEAISICQNILKSAPNFISARNNLATCYFHDGELQAALTTAQETYERFPENQYAQANLTKLNFLNGKQEQAERLADQLMANQPTEQDPVVAACEALTFLGRDNDVIELANNGLLDDEFDPATHGLLSHYLAVSQFRLGDHQQAKKYWNDCLAERPRHQEATDNLENIEQQEGHAAWAEPLSKWLPQTVVKRALLEGNIAADERQLADPDSGLFQRIPALKAMVPALLDRGDPLGRKFAFRLASNSSAPEMIEALQQFATSNRGPDSMRHQALVELHQAGHCESGPHRFYNRGQWTDIVLYCPEITDEPCRHVPEKTQQLAEQASEAIERGDYTLAESLYQKILDQDPTDYHAEFNLAIVWLRRDGRAGKQRAESVIQRLHEEHPDYLHAKIALAQFASAQGNSQEASRLLQEVMQQKKLHTTEATSLFATQVQHALAENNIPAAETAYQLLVGLLDNDHPTVIQVREQIDYKLNYSSLIDFTQKAKAHMRPEALRKLLD